MLLNVIVGALMAGVVGAAPAATHGLPLSVYAVSKGPLLNGVSVSRGGRVFASMPRWTSDATPGVAEVGRDGSFTPFPGGAWNDWRSGESGEGRLVSVRSVMVDEDDYLWVLDEGPPMLARTVAPSAGLLPKLVQFDLKRNEAIKVYTIGPSVAPEGSNLGHIQTDANFIYISEPGLGAIIVIDRKSGAMFRRLAGAPQSKADPTVRPVIAGRELLVRGEVPQVHLDLLELDKSGDWLYFMSLFGPDLYRIKVADLTNMSLDDAALAARIERVADVPPSTGLTKDREGRLYVCSITDQAILRLAADKSWEVIAQDPRIDIPNAPSFAPDGSFYFPVSRSDLAVEGKPAGDSTIFRIGPVL